ncbi:histidine phosphatase family protein [Desulfopila sp. IMCC35006]|uniref:histidine phosphatase family protein n=1 Tax=Desulfopila sp. IMCC35006 TaxID=2569542 RepID=UPI0010AD15B5|nr:histidine phosphatase family protein [Desulfopila sp. IMCC35006]TKB23826.1 histidine phosphatase family protein [Desulfopila sp. IMCC35006]
MKPSANDPAVVTVFGLLRHGQTEWNILKRIQGSADSPLSAQGKEQTDAWADTLKGYDWDRIIASDLGRVRATVDILNRKLCLPVRFDPRLREQHWGDWEGLTIPFIQQNFKEELARRIAMGWDFAAPGGETRRAVKDRVLTTLLESAQKWPGQKILIVCHQGVVKSVLYSLDDRDFLPGEDPLLQHNRLHLISCTGQGFAPLQLNIARTTP